jgi:shikimate kinase
MAFSARLLFLIGARGSGKTTVARLLAERLGRRFCDADALLEERAGATIRQIFADEGEAGFRDRESAVLNELAAGQDFVVATGGGVVLRPENRELLRQGAVVWLRARPEVLWHRLAGDSGTAEHRPNLAGGGLVEVEEVVHAREPLYTACADTVVDTDGRSPEECAEAIRTWLETFSA